MLRHVSLLPNKVRDFSAAAPQEEEFDELIRLLDEISGLVVFGGPLDTTKALHPQSLTLKSNHLESTVVIFQPSCIKLKGCNKHDYFMKHGCLD